MKNKLPYIDDICDQDKECKKLVEECKKLVEEFNNKHVYEYNKYNQGKYDFCVTYNKKLNEMNSYFIKLVVKKGYTVTDKSGWYGPRDGYEDWTYITY
jgi:hypothetical protein